MGKFQNERDSIDSRVLALHVADTCLIPGSPYVLLSAAGRDP